MIDPCIHLVHAPSFKRLSVRECEKNSFPEKLIRLSSCLCNLVIVTQLQGVLISSVADPHPHLHPYPHGSA
jgi:hypothetical protein